MKSGPVAIGSVTSGIKAPLTGQSLSSQRGRSQSPTPGVQKALVLTENYKQSDKADEFFNCVRSGNVSKVKAMVKAGDIDINWRDKTDACEPTALLIAADKDMSSMVMTLLSVRKQKTNINLEDKRGKRAIWLAAKNGNISITDELLKFDCEVNILDKETGTTPLFRAIMSNSEGVCQKLIHAKANVNLRQLGYSVGAESPIMKAVQLNNLPIVEMLINSRCDINARTDDGFTALHYAIAYRRYAIVECLLNNRIKMHLSSNNGVTSLVLAISHHNTAMCKILVEAGYRVDKKLHWRETPLEHAIKVHSEECAIFLAHSGCSLEQRKGMPSYFQQAAQEGLLDLMALLIDINPYFLQDKWVKNREPPVALFRKPDLCKLFYWQSENVFPLKNLCRLAIWKILDKYPTFKVERIPLPRELKDFVSLKRHISRDMLEQVPLDATECPFDCLSYCPRSKCTDIEYELQSDSDIE